jgi:site-specific recombinase XerD
VWLTENRSSSPQTCNNRLASIRSFLRYLSRNDISYLHLSNAAAQIPQRKIFKKKIHSISKKAIKTILSMPKMSIKTEFRDFVLMTILYSTATRIDEILSLKIEHINLDSDKPSITVIGKGEKIRTLFLLPKAVSILREYIRVFHGTKPNRISYVFYSRTKGIFEKMCQNAVTQQLRKYAHKAHEICHEVPLNLHAHQLRHAKASHWLEDGMNIVQISYLLGHTNIQTTMVYLDITIEEKVKALGTLEDEYEKPTSKKWHNSDGSLASFCGLPKINNKK